MKYLAVVLALAVLAQAAEIPRLVPRSELYPRAPVPQGPGYFAPTELPHTIDTRGFCGKSNVDTSSRIVGGVEATPHEFPWQVAITIDAGSFCGGSLISPDWVMTAAHCADGARRFSILLGAHNRNLPEASQVTVVSTEYTVHQNWSSLVVANDIALIRLPTPVTLTPEIQPICLAPSTESDHVGDPLLVSGWGKTSDGPLAGVSPTLNKVTAPGISTEQCKQTYAIATDKILCIDTTGGKGSCNGDSGGPLSFNNNGTWNQVGIVSFGSGSGCAAGYPAGFTRLSSYSQWIADNTGLII